VAHTAIDILGRIAGWPAGPILGKELRVASRQRRHFVLRTVYVLVLSAFTLLVWLSQVGTGSSADVGRTISRMSEAAKPTVASVAWFQFCMLQLVAVVLLSTAVSGEIRSRTLGVLMTTPIRPLQIVLGKLFSKLLQLLLLLALSVPVLSMIRLFGGVPWRFVVCTVCVTLTACLLAGAVSTLFSILFRRAFAAILLTLAVGLLVYVVLPGIVGLLLALCLRGPSAPIQTRVADWVMTVLLHLNPFGMQMIATMDLMQPGGMGGGPTFFSWPVHCAIMVGFTALVLFLCTLLVRRAGLRQAVGGSSVAEPAASPLAPVLPVPAAAPVASATAGGRQAGGRVRRVRGSPVLWKELRTPLTRSLVGKIVGTFVPLSIVAVMYLLIGLNEALDSWEPHAMFVCAYLIIGMVVTAVVAATPIAGEKESQSWPLLLATPLTSGRILWGKFAGVVVRVWPAWVLLTGHIIVFMICGFLSPVLTVVAAVEIVGLVVFLTGSGLLFSALFRRTTTAVVMNLGLAIAIWAALPVLLAFTSPVVGSDALEEMGQDMNPVVRTWNVTEKHWVGKPYPWVKWDPRRERAARLRTTKEMSGLMVKYAVVGLCLAGVAQLQVRCRAF